MEKLSRDHSQTASRKRQPKEKIRKRARISRFRLRVTNLNEHKKWFKAVEKLLQTYAMMENY